MVTIIVGGANGSNCSSVVTLTENIAETEKAVSFDMDKIAPGGSPK